MKANIPVKQLATMSMLVATAVAVRVSMSWLAFAVAIPIYGVIVKIGLSETLAFTSGFVFGPIQGFITGVLVIVISDLFTWAGPWTPVIAAIIGLLGICGGLLRRLRKSPSVTFLGVTAVLLTLMSESLQNLYTTWFYLVSGMPLIVALGMAFSGGITSMITAIINNAVLFTTIVPRIISILQRMVMGHEKNL